MCFENKPWQSGSDWHSQSRCRRTVPAVKSEFEETLKKQVGGSLRNVPVFKRVEMLRANARALTQQTKWKQPPDDGTLVRKIVGASH